MIKKSEEPSLTHLEKAYWPKEGYTKGDLIEYYRHVSRLILPYLKDRPQILHRFPNGIEAEGFYQKNADSHFPEWVLTIPVMHSDKTVNYLEISDLRSLLFAINLGCIDLNPFNSRKQQLDYPDYMIFDLDPERIAFGKVVETAQTIREILESANISSFCKTSGSRGLHIYVPLGARYTYAQSRKFAQLIAEMAHERLPKITSLIRSPEQRQGKVYIDYLQNNFGQTVAAPYSIRPLPGAPVSTPLNWSEVNDGLDPKSFTLPTIFKRLEKVGDLFFPILGKGIDMQRCLDKLSSVI